MRGVWKGVKEMNRRTFLKRAGLALASAFVPKQKENAELRSLDQRHIQSAFWWYLYTCRFRSPKFIEKNVQRLRSLVTDYKLFWGEEYPTELLDEVRDEFSWAYDKEHSTNWVPDNTRERCECGEELLTPWDYGLIKTDVKDERFGIKWPFAHITTTNPQLHVFCPGCGKVYLFQYSLVRRREV